MTDESGRPGTVRSNVGCDAIEEPCTNNTAGLPAGVTAYFSHKNSRTSPLWVQCSTPVTRVPAALVSMSVGSVDFCAGFTHDSAPEVTLGVKELPELGGGGAHDFNAGRCHVGFHG